MFTGIIETRGFVRELIPNGNNISWWVASPISGSLHPDQSVSHNGVCLTIEEVRGDEHRITAIRETLKKTNLARWQVGTAINLERCLLPSDRIEGHIVQGHIDGKAICTGKKEKKGSWEFRFRFPKKFAGLVTEKGSVCLNGISLTCFDVKKKSFRVAIIPYTFEHTNMRDLNEGDEVNIEFDIINKVLLRNLSLKKE